MVLTIILSIISLSCNQQKTKWQGSIKEVDGVTVVKNPKRPLYDEDVVGIKEVLSIGKTEGEEEYMFSQLRDITVDDAGNIYVLDIKEANVKKFSKDGEYIKSIGKKGQGPGEIGMPAFITISKQNEIVVEDPMSRRFAFFSFDGDFIKNLSFAKMSLVQIELDKEGNIIGGTIDMKKQVYEVRKVSPEIDFICSYGSSPLSRNPQISNPFKPMLRWAVLPDDTVVCGNAEEYMLEVYNPNGEIIKKILKDYDPVKITEEEIEEKKKEAHPGRKLEIPTHHGPFYWFTVDDEGRIFVRTYKKASDGNGYYYNIFDKDGKYLADILLMALPQVIKNNMIYTIEENQAGFHVVKKYELTYVGNNSNN